MAADSIVDKLLEAFTLRELAHLALLLPFRDSIHLGAWMRMGTQLFGAPPEDEPFTTDDAVALLGDASEMDLVTFDEDGHPMPRVEVIRLFFNDIRLAIHIPEEIVQATFVDAMGWLGFQLSQGPAVHVSSLRMEETNLLGALQMGRKLGDGRSVLYIVPALETLWLHTGRLQEWRGLMQDLIPDFIDLENGQPRPQQEDHWSQVTQWRIDLARRDRQWDQVLALQRARVQWDRQRAGDALGLPRESLVPIQRNLILSLAGSLLGLAQTLQEQENADCLPLHLESKELFESLGYDHQVAAAGFNLGLTYLLVPALRDLDQAERWFQESLQQRSPEDAMGRGRCVAELGGVAYERFQEARRADADGETLLGHLNHAIGFYRASLEDFPEGDSSAHAISHGQLGHLYAEVQYVDDATMHFLHAIRYFDQAEDVFRASEMRARLARLLGHAERWQEGLPFAQEALAGFENLGDTAAEQMQSARQLIEHMKDAL